LWPYKKRLRGKKTIAEEDNQAGLAWHRILPKGRHLPESDQARDDRGDQY
jgi:hypothetical protein